MFDYIVCACESCRRDKYVMNVTDWSNKSGWAEETRVDP